MSLDSVANEGCDGKNAMAIDGGITILCKNGQDCPHVPEFTRPVHYGNRVLRVCGSPEVRKAYDDGKVTESKPETVSEAMVSGAEVSKAYGKVKGLF